MEGVARGEVEGDEVAVEALAGLLQRLVIGGAQGEDVVGLNEVTDAVVLVGLGEGDGAAPEEAEFGGCGEGELRGYGTSLGNSSEVEALQARTL